MLKLYKIAKLLQKELFPVSSRHSLSVEQYGNPNGIPVIHLHGGPGGYPRAKNTKFYNSEKYKIILFDQRGCGKSTPLGETKENTTADLVSDMEKIRLHLGIDKWVVSGGSWGSTLALCYAEKYPERVKALIIRGVFTGRKFEQDWVEGKGANYFFPDRWEEYLKLVPENERENILSSYAKRILGEDKDVSWLYAQSTFNWENSISSIKVAPIQYRAKFEMVDYQGCKIFYHYETNNNFLEEGQIIKGAYKLKDIPGVIIQGRYDMICPPITAWELHKAWPKADFFFTFAGHHSGHRETLRKILEYTDKYSH